MRSDEIHPGDVIAGKYRVRAILSRNPTFTVEAFHVEFDQRVVIKLLLPGTADDKEVERFRREARMLARLETEHAARIIDVGVQRDGTFYLVRQHVEGEDLETYVRRNGPRSLEEAATLVLQAAECAAEAHSYGIVLREIAPQHMVLSRRRGGAPLLKVTDFGTAKLMRDAGSPSDRSSLTVTALFGLSPYSSPELVRKAKSIDPRTDVWSLGAVLYFLLGGRAPFHGDVTQLMLAIVREEPLPITRLRADLPPQLDDIVGWSMAKDVDRRFKNVHALAHELAAFTGSEGHVLLDRIAATSHAPREGLDERGRDDDPLEISATSLEEDHEPFMDDAATEILDSGGLQQYARELTDNMGVPNSIRPQAVSAYPSHGTSQPGMVPAGSMIPGSMQQGPVSYAGRGLSVPPPTPSIPPSPFPQNLPRSVAPFRQPPQPEFAPPRVEGPRPDTVAPATLATITAGARSARRGVGRDLRVVWGGLAAMAVMLPVVLLLLLRDPPNQPAVEGPITVGQAPTPAAPPKMGPSPASEPVRLDPAPAAPSPEAPPPTEPSIADLPAEPVAKEPVKEPVAERPRTEPAGVAARAPAPSRPTKSEPTAPKKPEPVSRPDPKREEPAASGGGSGRLLAIASGGSCSFSVDGATKGNGSSLSVSLPAGKHSVTCKPLSGSAKSRSVTIKRNETSMLTFKL